MKSRSSGSILLVIGALLGFSIGYAIRGNQEIGKPVSHQITQETYSVSRVIDGDTLDIKGGIEILLSRIRLLGIDTPERGQPLYKEAADKLEELISGRAVSLERDNNNADRYGRALRYIIVDNQNLNVEMIRLGYARAYMFEGLKYEKQIVAAEKEAKLNKRGIWQADFNMP